MSKNLVYLAKDPDLILTIRYPSNEELFFALNSKPALIEQFDNIPDAVQVRLVRMHYQFLLYIKHPCDRAVKYVASRKRVFARSLFNISDDQWKTYCINHRS